MWSVLWKEVVEVPLFIRRVGRSGGYLEADDGEGAVGQQGRRTLGIVHVIALMFFTVSGGSVGSEGIISSLGPLPGLLGLAIFPLLVTLPLGLISAELSTAFPTSGSYITWCYEAFGWRTAFLNLYSSYFAGVMDSAIYPILFVEYLSGALFLTRYRPLQNGS